MPHGAVRRGALAVIVAVGVLLESLPARADASCHQQAIARALRLLPRQPQRVVLVERADVATAHGSTANVEAFIYRGGPAVYVVRQGSILRAACKGAGIFDYALAATIWHEMAHVDGADEPAAQRAEAELWRRFVLKGEVDRSRGLKYLALLDDRR
jgi:hypothetical protein